MRVRGLELEARGPIAQGLDLIASYAYTDSRVTRVTRVTRANANASGLSVEGNRFPYVPEQQVLIWLDYQFQSEALAGLVFGIGARHTSATYGDNANRYRVPGVTLYDMALRWDLGRVQPALEGVRLALNVANLSNKHYVATCIASTGCYWGEGRSMYLTAGYRW